MPDLTETRLIAALEAAPSADMRELVAECFPEALAEVVQARDRLVAQGKVFWLHRRWHAAMGRR